MARKTFISYKYSEAQGLRDKILKALGDDTIYYQGETSDSPDLTDTSTENIKENLKDMMHGTSVTIVVISPNLKNSKWIDWEIEYSLKEITRKDKTSRTNGVVGVIMKWNGDYGWIVGYKPYDDGCKPRTIENSKVYQIISKNRYNLIDPIYICERCKTVDKLSGSYISLIEEEDFLKDPSKYIENAYEKCEKIDTFDITKTR
jgi:hypothetical protein